MYELPTQQVVKQDDYCALFEHANELAAFAGS